MQSHDLTLAVTTTYQAFDLKDLTDPVAVLNAFGGWVLAGLLLVVFIESGVLFPVLPGDSLLFVAGLLASAGAASSEAKSVGFDGSFVPLWVLLVTVPIAAVLGSQVGYLVGRFGGEKLFKPESRFLKQQYLDDSHAFFEKYGPITILLARFVPFVRTFAPLVAGAAKMTYAKFLMWNVIGALVWGLGVTLLGVWLGRFAVVRDHIDIIFIVIVLASIAPLLIGAAKKVLANRRAPAA